MDNLKLVQQLIDNIHTSLDTISKLLLESQEQPFEIPPPSTQTYQIQPNYTAKSLSVDQLGPLPNIADPLWPLAVPDESIVGSSDIKTKVRATLAEGTIGPCPVGLTVLDYGSHDGSIARQLGKSAKKCYAYDIDKNCQIYNTPDSKYEAINHFDNFSKANVGQIDLIVLFDVLDHLVGIGAIELLSQLKSLLSPNGRIFLRCHPWTARTGGHLYTQRNKAFLHLALTPEELLAQGLTCSPNIKVNKPLATYEHMISMAELHIERKRVHTLPVEPYFSGPLLSRIIKSTWAGNISEDKALKIMSINYIDWVLL